MAGVPGIRHERGYLAQKEQPGLEFSPRFETGEGATQDEPAASSGGGTGRRSHVVVVCIIIACVRVTKEIT